MPDHITVAEFAELAGVSTQAVYKQTGNPNSRLAPYVVRQGKKTMIDPAALQDFYGVEQPETKEQPNLPTQATQTTQELASLTTDYVEFLKSELSNLQEKNNELNSIIAAKDALIENQAAQLADLAREITDIAQKALTTTSQQQFLAAVDKGAKGELSTESTETNQNQPNPTPKRTFWKRWFG